VRLAYLDGLRAAASLYVVMFHAVLGFAPESLVGPWRLMRRAFAFGHEAVAIFIVLSGYCLMLPLARRGVLSVDLGTFLKRRAFRILPPYFACLVLSLALLALPVLRTPNTGTIWDNSLPGFGFGAIVSHLLLVHNWSPLWGYQINGPLWSVASEWQIYFFFPLVLLPVWRRAGAVSMLAVAALLGFLPLLFWAGPAHVAIPWYLLLFAFGMSSATLGFSDAALAQRWRQRAPLGPICAACWAICFALSMGLPKFWFSSKPVTDVLVGLASATLLAFLTRRANAETVSRGLLLRVLESRPLVGVGHFSYSLYLTHLPIVALSYFALRAQLAGPWLVLALAAISLVLALALAYGFFLVVERRFIHR
jgi:peptidoglycan/LPS O-acetylase OafA/YrhL